MYNTLKKLWGADSDYPSRTQVLQNYQRILDGSIYNKLTVPFHQEFNDSNNKIPLYSRIPCVRYNLSKIIVEHSASLVFSDSRFPTIQTKDEELREQFKVLVKETNLPQTMIDAVFKGSIGSAAIMMRILDSRVYFEVLDTVYLQPVWMRNAPNTLEFVRYKKKFTGRELMDEDPEYNIDVKNLATVFWLQIDYTQNEEIWYVPKKRDRDPGEKDEKPFVRDDRKSRHHGLKFVPIKWIANLPGGNKVDGLCTFEGAIDIQIQIEYLLSQAARALKFNCDPLLYIAGALAPEMGPDGKLKRDSTSVLLIDEGSKAGLLEINGDSIKALEAFAANLRLLAMEAVRGNRISPDKVNTGEISGRAVEMSLGPLLLLCDNLRTSYGEHGLLDLMKMVAKASQTTEIYLTDEDALNKKQFKVAITDKLSLKWPHYFRPTEYDLNQQALTGKELTQANLISQETYLKHIANSYDIEDIDEEMSLIAIDRAARLDEEVILNTKSVVAADKVAN